MAPFILSSNLLLVLFTAFSSCAPQDSKSRLTKRATAKYKARIYYADACTESHKSIIDILISDGSSIFDAQGYVSFPTAFLNVL